MSRFRISKFGALAAGIAIVALSVPDAADARRGGSFGSRGARTHTAPASTAVAPKQAAPVQRSMTEKQAGNPAAQAGRNAPARSGGMAKGLIGGLIAGGLIGAMLGGGLGSLGGSGMLMALLQVALLGGLAFFLFRMFRRRSAAATASAGPSVSNFAGMDPRASNARGNVSAFSPANAAAPVQSQGFSGGSFASAGADISIEDADRNDFQRLLTEIQDAFSREDYAGLRERTTPEVMSYFAEELGQNATNGRRNQVSGTELIDAEVAEAWHEGTTDYATIAMRYDSIDVMLDRSTGAVIEGDSSQPTRTTELWTFKRELQGPWRLSAIQES